MSSDFNVHIEPVALKILPEFIGDPNRALSSKTELRWGKNGSFSVDLVKNTWHDHEDQTGGGVLDLLRAFKGFEKPEAVEWLQEQGYLERRERPNGAADGTSPQGKFAGFMDTWPVATFEYFDDRGRLAYEILKFAKTAPRRYMQRRPHPSGKGWIWALQEGLYGKIKSGDWFKAKEGKHYETEEQFPEAPRWLYRRDEVLQAKAEGKPVILAEGEKDVETLRAWGFVATTNAGGAKYWQESFDEDLDGADVIICGDNDDSSRQRTLLRGAGLKPRAKSVRVLDLALHWKDCPPKADVTDWKDQHGGTAEKFAVLLKKAPHWTPVRPREFGAYYHDEIDGPGLEYDYVIDGLLTARGRSVFGGPSGSGKSFFALHAAYCIGRGQEFFGHAVERGGVIYQAGEGGLGMKKRQKAYRKHFKVDDDEDIPLVVLPAKVDLFAREGDTDKLIATIKAIKITMSVPLRVVFIDTLATATIGADENSGKDMSVVLANIARIEHECGVHVCLVHHMNADGKKLRGHTSIHANVDTVVVITMDDNTRIRTARLAKQKDDEDGLKIPFTLASVEVGENPKTSKPITSCVVLTVSEKDALKKEQQQFGYSVRPTEEALLIPMFRAIKKYGRFVAEEKDGPPEAVGKHVVDFGHFLDVAVEMDASENDKIAARAKIRKAFERNTSYLIKHQVIAFKRTSEKAALVWWTGKPIRGFPHTFPDDMRNRTNTGQSPDISETFSPPPISPGLADMIDSDQEILL
ncbi:AAA family ATPase [Aminobacter carboxidus]|uniref:AAA family ATPase n=1 Tax=Aminobacter carboxidus TaxID=376165 RepID=A0ABR9GWT0_9HYPH|nr:AAA family ATPase [Aminobacter carboxidus]MBE1208131.1 AAA family ATPase [Aminobacter carboxidus]